MTHTILYRGEAILQSYNLHHGGYKTRSLAVRAENFISNLSSILYQFKRAHVPLLVVACMQFQFDIFFFFELYEILTDLIPRTRNKMTES